MGETAYGQRILAQVDAPRGNVRAGVSGVALHELTAHCTSCVMRGFCLAGGLDSYELEKFDDLAGVRLSIKRKTRLFRQGDRFTALYAVRRGSFKTVVLTEDGEEHITGYHLSGGILGFDGIAADHYACAAIALEDSEICVLPYAQLDSLSGHLPTLRRNLLRRLARDLCLDQSHRVWLAIRSAEQRVALFLLDVAERYAARGRSDHEFVLRMTREEIGNFLGLKLETVSRIFSGLRAAGLIQVRGRTVKLLDTLAIKSLVDRSSTRD